MRTFSFFVSCCVVLFTSFLISVLPIWQVWHFSSWEAVGHFGSLWEAVEAMTQENPPVPTMEWVFVWHGYNWIQSVVLLTVVGLITALSARLHARGEGL